MWAVWLWAGSSSLSTDASHTLQLPGTALLPMQPPVQYLIQQHGNDAMADLTLQLSAACWIHGYGSGFQFPDSMCAFANLQSTGSSGFTVHNHFQAKVDLGVDLYRRTKTSAYSRLCNWSNA